MRAKAWLLRGSLGAALALSVTYLVLQPASSIYAYAALLGWSGIIGVLIVMIQGFQKIGKRLSSHSSSTGIVRYDFAINRWGGIHTALSIAVTILVGIHGFLFFPGLLEFSLPIWLGASAFIVLIVLNLSGILTESKRKSRDFGSLKALHVVLMLIVLAVSVLHIELLVGASYARSIVDGAIIAFVVMFVVFVSVPITLRALSQ